MPNREQFHQLLAELLTEVADSRGRKLHDVLDELATGFGVARATVESWYRSDRGIPAARIVEDLVLYIAAYRVGDAERLKALLDAADYRALRKLDLDARTEYRDVPNNLPSLGQDNPVFVGRGDELRTLLADLEYRQDRLDVKNVPLAVIEVAGPGGIGKTELVLQAAHRCYLASTGELALPWVPPFRAIVFVSAKQHRLEPRGFVPVDPEEALRPMRDLFRKIAGVLDPGTLAGSPEGLEERVRQQLATRPGQRPVLLILDNLEVLPVDIEHRLSEFLYRPPMGVKVVFTSRNQTGIGTRLSDLTEGDATTLLRARAAFHRAHNRQGFELTREQEHLLYSHIGGNPAALIFTMGRLANSTDIDQVLDEVTSPRGDVAEYCFLTSVDPIRTNEPETYQLLLALGLFPQGAQLDAICAAAWPKRDPNPSERMRCLFSRSLVQLQDGRYELPELTRTFVLRELAAQPTYADDARHRWADWYRNWTHDHGGLDLADWGSRFDVLNLEYQNILAVLEWCSEMRTSRCYAILRDILQSITSYTSLFGFWSDRIEWLRWLIRAAQQHGDPATVVWAQSDLGWIWTLMGGEHLERAEEVLNLARVEAGVAPRHVQCEILLNLANLELRRANYSVALEWTKQAFNTLPETGLAHLRKWATAVYQRAEIHRARGQLDAAVKDYEEAIATAATISFARLRLYAEHGLAEVALERAREAKDAASRAAALADSRRRLQKCLEVARTNHERRRVALLTRTSAEVAWVAGDVVAFRELANEAAEQFCDLKMDQEHDEAVRELRRRCESPPKRQHRRQPLEVLASLREG